MKNSKLKQCLSIVILALIFLHIGVARSSTGTFGERVFQLQKKQAERGNTLAQYKLGTFFEYGISVEANNDVAASWYKKAADKKYLPAVNRLTYLDIKKGGYDEFKHMAWLQNVKSDAESNKVYAIILLGQMHHQGIAVKKDLNKAINLLSNASSKGHTEVDAEIDQINLKILKINNKKAADKKQKLPAKSVKKVKSKKIVKKKKSKKKKDNSEARKQRYEEAMKKLKQENQLLDQQQDWSEN